MVVTLQLPPVERGLEYGGKVRHGAVGGWVRRTEARLGMHAGGLQQEPAPTSRSRGCLQGPVASYGRTRVPGRVARGDASILQSHGGATSPRRPRKPPNNALIRYLAHSLPASRTFIQLLRFEGTLSRTRETLAMARSHRLDPTTAATT